MLALPAADTAHVLVAIAALLVAAQLGGVALARVRQPRVIGEIAGGLVLGPTVLGAVWPDAHDALFPGDGPTPAALAVLYQLGLVLLMFAAGTQVRAAFGPGERRVGAVIAVAGTALPFAVGAALFALLDLDGLAGSAGDDRALAIVFAASVAVTSIPVISRIMLDLGILESSFGRIVLAAAVAEDVALYALIAVAIGLAAGDAGAWGAPELLGLEPGSAAVAVYYAGASVGVVALAISAGPALHQRLSAARWNGLARTSPLAYQLISLLAIVVGCLALGLTTILGGLLAGIVAGARPDARASAAIELVGRFSLAFFVPVYFAVVGLRLDLADHLDVAFFAWFLAVACAVKAGSVYLGARLAREGAVGARNLAIAMNARGGPGIVIASAALDAGIVDEAFHASLVLLAIVTSAVAGWWLERVVRAGEPLR